MKKPPTIIFILIDDLGWRALALAPLLLA